MKIKDKLQWPRFIILIPVLALINIMLAEPIFGYEGHSVPTEVPGDYDGKWYGVYCPELTKGDLVGLPYGDAFPNQAIMSSWGYKAKPIEGIKDLIPEMWYDICTHPDLWGETRINETAFIPRDKYPGDQQQLMMKFTEQNKGTARVDERGHLINYKNGHPFPGSTNGVEIAWNFVNSLNYGQSMYANFYVGITDKKGGKRYSKADQNYFWMKGRIHGENIPNYEPNPNNYLWLQAMGFTYPYDLKGIVILTYRYDDPDREDDQWMYITSLRRVRRMSASQRWDKLPGGQDITYDAATGFQGKPTNYEWKYLGRKVLLCSRQAKDELQEIKDKPGGGTADQLYQRVNTVMLEYVPKIVSSVSKAVMYLDPETYACYYADFLDRRGRPYLFYNHCWAVDKSGVMFPIGFFVGDVQRIHSSNNYTYYVIVDLDAEKKGITPSYYNMENLRNVYKGR
ncbi:conserved hypothetical protein [uncultured Desulfobacterium sp.]|uniref:DUF1329 domain-containing protein n=1 Tax=uncultured Desulfobacterium sp. TaxID=201089 RepID=A0A445N181_9BACT|nr:conserved hypothetical protein [uncultured Desulfobacterium sp.]